MMQYAFLIAAIILAACSVPPVDPKPIPSEIPDSAIPLSQPVEVVAPREEPKEPEKPRKAAPKPPLKNPLSDCSDVDHLDDPKQATRARLDCMTDRLEQRP